MKSFVGWGKWWKIVLNGQYRAPWQFVDNTKHISSDPRLTFKNSY